MTNEEKTVISSIDEISFEGDKKPHLTFIKGSRIGQLVELVKKEIIVGRSPDCDVWIDDNTISRRHFKLAINGSEVWLEDLGSTNGTYVNGEVAKKTRLEDGCKIQISQDTLLEFNFLDESRSLSEKKLYEMGVIDPVCDIYNKRYFIERLKEEFAIAKRKGGLLSLVMFDIDYFKKINDTHGHLAGDLVLQKIGQVAKTTVRSGDILARYGGEEFVVIMREAAMEDAFRLAERIRQSLAASFIMVENKKITFTVSLGIACYESAMKEPVDLIAEADKYLYQSKSAGRNRTGKADTASPSP